MIVATMANLASQDSDDFDYDFSLEDEEALIQLATSARPVTGQVPDSAEAIHATDFTYSNCTPRSHNAFEQQSYMAAHAVALPRTLPSPVSLDGDIQYPDLSRALKNIKEGAPPPAVQTADQNKAPKSLVRGQESDDGRSPLQRFRSYPKKPLTVSDLTSGAWCELQYFYTLTRLPGGRRTRTAAMRQGSAMHQKLEDEVHAAVKIDIVTKEDAFGLRLWNFVQGLRTLRDMGLTRELEVWGMIDGNLVNGIIDSVSYDNPNEEFEEELSSQDSQAAQLQTSIRDFFPQKSKTEHHRKVYLTDVKTRRSRKPVTRAVVKPAKVQLLLYHMFLCDMAAGKLDYLKVFRRYGLDPDDTFSDTFMAEIGGLHDEIFDDTPASSAGEAPNGSSQAAPTSSDITSSGEEDSRIASTPDLLKYNTLRDLIALVKDEIRLTFPEGADSIGQMLRVHYIHQETGQDIDVSDFPVSRVALEKYLSKYMEWWRGERPAEGVEIEEGFKCQTCEFGNDCSWRESLGQRILAQAEERKRARQANAR
ncbi:hypothetical protein V2G26_015363 [Clonostachys chloroleuca]